MTEALSSTSRWRAYAGLLVKVVVLSWPVLALLAALQTGPVIFDNIAAHRQWLANLGPPLVMTAKLFGLFVGVMLLAMSATFWVVVARKPDAPK